MAGRADGRAAVLPVRPGPDRGPPAPGTPAGTAVPFAVGRHRHPKTRTPDGQARTEPAPTGIDYLSALGDGHDEALREQVSYRFLIGGPQEKPAKQEDPEEKEGNGRD